MKDSSKFYHRLKSQLKDKKPFVAYRKPWENDVHAIFQNDNATCIAKDFRERGFVFAPFNSEAPAYLLPENQSEILVLEDEQGQTKAVSVDGKEIKGIDYELMEKDQKAHEKLVQEAIDTIKKENLEKVVISRSEKTEVHDPDPVRIFKSLLKKYPGAFVYVWFHPETDCWLGATPETLLSAERNRFKTMALAGTQVYEEDKEAEWTPKEVQEQLLVTDYILESLEKLEGVSNIRNSSPYTKRAGRLLHICTDISGNLKDPDDLPKIIETLHPTPAVCGLPKDKALQFILEKEGYSREYYSGFLGEINLQSSTKRNANRKNQENQQFSAISRKTDLFVNLRCMKLKDGNANIYVGGGITKDSNAGDEWVETMNKAQTIKSSLVK